MDPGTVPGFGMDVGGKPGDTAAPLLVPPTVGVAEPALASGFASGLMRRGGFMIAGGGLAGGPAEGPPLANELSDVEVGLLGKRGGGPMGVVPVSLAIGLVEPAGPPALELSATGDGDDAPFAGNALGSEEGKVGAGPWANGFVSPGRSVVGEVGGAAPLFAAFDRLFARLRSRLLPPLRLFGSAGILGPSCEPAGRGGGGSCIPVDAGPRVVAGSPATVVELESLSAGLVWLAIPIGAVRGESSKPDVVSSGNGGFDADATSAKCGPTSVPSVTAAAPPGNMLAT